MPSINPKYFPILSSPSSPRPSSPFFSPSSFIGAFRTRLPLYICIVQAIALLVCFSLWTRSGVGVGESWCGSEFGKGVCEVYGSHNVKLSRLYEGTSTRLNHIFHRVRTENAPFRIGAIGGSVTLGHGLGSKDDTWITHVFQTLSSVHNPGEKNLVVNGAVPAVGTGYFSACFSSHLPAEEMDIIFVELSINDDYREEDARSFEELIRGLLELPQQPAVVVVDTVGLSAPMLAVGGDMHLPIATFYDAPVISLRPLVLPAMMRGGKGSDYFDEDGWGDPDYRHINERSHAALADLVSSFLLEKWDRSIPSSNILSLSSGSDLTFSPDSSRPSSFWPGAERLMSVPKTLFFQNFDPSTSIEPLAPVCYTASQGPYVNSIFPLLSSSQNWTSLTPTASPDKTYLSSSHPSATFSLSVPVRQGKIQIYYLRAGGKYGLGSVECWIGDDWDGRRRFDGWWDDWRPHIGQFGIVATHLPSGTHQLSCRVMEETRDPGGGTNFRIISVAGI